MNCIFVNKCNDKTVNAFNTYFPHCIDIIETAQQIDADSAASCTLRFIQQSVDLSHITHCLKIGKRDRHGEREQRQRGMGLVYGLVIPAWFYMLPSEKRMRVKKEERETGEQSAKHTQSPTRPSDTHIHLTTGTTIEVPAVNHNLLS